MAKKEEDKKENSDSENSPQVEEGNNENKETNQYPNTESGAKTTSQFKIDEDVVTTSNVQDLVKQETNILENKYLKWVISIGIGFLFFKAVDTASEIKFLMGKQENFDKTINMLFEERTELIDNLKEKNSILENDVLGMEKLKFENEKLQFEIKKLKGEK